jgi:hypothetical protein
MDGPHDMPSSVLFSKASKKASWVSSSSEVSSEDTEWVVPTHEHTKFIVVFFVFIWLCSLCRWERALICVVALHLAVVAGNFALVAWCLAASILTLLSTSAFGALMALFPTVSAESLESGLFGPGLLGGGSGHCNFVLGVLLHESLELEDDILCGSSPQRCR